MSPGITSKMTSRNFFRTKLSRLASFVCLLTFGNFEVYVLRPKCFLKSVLKTVTNVTSPHKLGWILSAVSTKPRKKTKESLKKKNEMANWSLRQGDEEVNTRMKQKNIYLNKFNCTDPGLQLGDPAPLIALLLWTCWRHFMCFESFKVRQPSV